MPLLEHGLDVFKIITHISKLYSLDLKLVYLKNYIFEVGIVLNSITLFICKPDKIRLNCEVLNYYLESICVNPARNTLEKLAERLEYEKDKMIILIKELNDALNLIAFAGEKNIDWLSLLIGPPVDNRIHLLLTKAQVLLLFKLFAAKNFMEELSPEEIFSHVTCIDYKPDPDPRYINKRMQWKSRHTKIILLINLIWDAGWLDVPEEDRYQIILKHYVDKNGQSIKDPSNKYYNIKNSKTPHKDVKNIIAEVNNIKKTISEDMCCS